MAQVNITKDDVSLIIGELYTEKEAIRKYAESLEKRLIEGEDGARLTAGKILNLEEEVESSKGKLEKKTKRVRRRAATASK